MRVIYLLALVVTVTFGGKVQAAGMFDWFKGTPAKENKKATDSITQSKSDLAASQARVDALKTSLKDDNTDPSQLEKIARDLGKEKQNLSHLEQKVKSDTEDYDKYVDRTDDQLAKVVTQLQSEGPADKKNDPSNKMMLQGIATIAVDKINQLKIQDSFSKVMEGVKDQELTLRTVELKLDQSVMGNYMRMKMARMLNSAQFCAKVQQAKNSCDGFKDKVTTDLSNDSGMNAYVEGIHNPKTPTASTPAQHEAAQESHIPNSAEVFTKPKK